MTDIREAGTHRAATLARIADALGVAVESFSDEGSSARRGETAALLTAYGAIADVQGRRRVLTLALAEAARCPATAEGSAPVP